MFSFGSISRMTPFHLFLILIFTFANPAITRGDQPCLGNDPAWIFCTGFEEGNLDIWDDYDGNPPETNTLLPHPGPFGHPDNHVIRLRAPEGRGGADLIKVFPRTYDRLYARWYVMWEPGYDFNAEGHGSGLFAGDRELLGFQSGFRPDGSDKFSANLEPDPTEHRLNFYSYYRGMYQDCVDPEGSCWGDAFPCFRDQGEAFCTVPEHRPGPLPPVLETGRWYRIEMFMDSGAPSADGTDAGGILNFWIDGVAYGPWDGLWLRTTTDLEISLLWLQLWHHGDHSVEGILLDEVVVSTEPIGDATVPARNENWGTLKSQYR